MTIAELHQQTVATLKKHPKKVAQRQNAIAALARGNEKTKKLVSQKLIPREGVWFSTTQGNVAAGKGELSVQMLGEGVGTLEFNQGQKCWWFRPTDENQEALLWSNNREHGEAIKKYLQECKVRIRAKQGSNLDEREIQWQLAKALSVGKKDRNPSLSWLQPIKMRGFPLEIGVSVTKDGEVKDRSTGNIDLLLRKPGGRSGGSLLVLELKAPGVKKRKDIQSALKQAVRYATALDFEANGDGDDNAAQHTTLASYRSAFGLKTTAKGKLRIGIVIAMCDWGVGFQHTARQLLDEYCQDLGESHIGWIDMLLYDVPDETAHGWRWLENWNPPAQLRRVKR